MSVMLATVPRSKISRANLSRNVHNSLGNWSCNVGSTTDFSDQLCHFLSKFLAMPSNIPSPTWSADQYGKHGKFVAELAAPLLQLLQLRPEERVLDLGCGTGVLTEELAATGATVIGVDSAQDLLAAAKARGLDVRLMDAERLTFDAEFDAVFSNAALHWMRNAEAVIAGVRRALRPGGRFVGELGGHGNIATIMNALVHVLSRRAPHGSVAFPWYFPTVEEYHAQLEAGGFLVDSIALLPRPTTLTTDLGGWLDTFAHPIFAQLPSEERRTVGEEVIRLLEPALCDAQGHWTLDYVRIRFAARTASK